MCRGHYYPAQLLILPKGDSKAAEQLPSPNPSCWHSFGRCASNDTGYLTWVEVWTICSFSLSRFNAQKARPRCSRDLNPLSFKDHSIIVHILFLIYPSVGKGVSSSFWLLWIKLLWMCLYKYPWKPLISFFWIDVQKRNYCIMWYWVCFFLYYLFWETGSPFSILAHHLTLLATEQQNFTSLARIVIFYFFKNVVVMTLWCIYSEVELFHQNWNCWNKGSRVIMWIF